MTRSNRLRVLLLFVLAAAAGCASMPGSRTPLGDGAEFEVGKADHVNLWPLLDVKTGGRLVTSVIWPVFAYNAGERLTVRPVFSYYPGHDFNVAWPLSHFELESSDPSWVGPVWWKSRSAWGVFPLFWKDEGQHVVFPLVFQGYTSTNDNYFYTAPLGGYLRNRSSFGFQIGPYAHLAERGRAQLNALVPLYWYWSESPERSFMWFAAGLGGFARRERPGATKSGIPNRELETWAFPLWYSYGDHSAAGSSRFVSFPFSYGRDGSSDSWFAIPPLFSWWGREGRERFSYVLGGIGHYEKKDGESARGFVFPFAAWEKTRFLSPLYARDAESELVLPLYYRNWNTETFYTLLAGKSGRSHWVAPLYVYNSRPDGYSFVSLPYLGWRTAATRGFVVPPLLSARSVSTNGVSWYSPFLFRDADSGVTFIPPVLSGWFRNDAGGTDGLILWVVGGWSTGKDGHYKSHWAWPFYYRDAEQDFWIAGPLLSGWKGGKDAAAYLLLGLGGWSRGKTGALAAHWILPLYYRNVSDGSFDTVLFGSGPHRLTFPWLLSEFRNGGRGASLLLNLGGYDVTPHAGNAIARYDLRHHMFPFYSVRRLFDPAAVRAVLDSPDPVKFRAAKTWDGPDYGVGSGCLGHRNETHFLTYYSEDSMWVSGPRMVTGLVSRVEKDSRGQPSTTREELVDGRVFAPTGRLEVTVTETSGIFPFTKGATTRTVAYKGSRLVKDKETYEFQSALNKVNTSTNRLTGAFKSSRSFLYKVYQSKTENGAHSVDVFPGYTHADRSDGFTSTSFMWRLYRRESDPKGGTTKVDLLFIPLWR